MNHPKVEVGKVDEPMCLLAVKRLRLAKVSEVFVISEDLHREGRAVKIMAPGFQGTDDREEFTVIDVVISFSRGERL